MLVVAGLALTTKNITDYRIPKLHYDNILLNIIIFRSSSDEFTRGKLCP